MLAGIILSYIFSFDDLSSQFHQAVLIDAPGTFQVDMKNASGGKFAYSNRTVNVSRIQFS